VSTELTTNYQFQLLATIFLTMNPRVTFLSLAALNVISGLVFLPLVDQPVFDDIFNSTDISHYISLGISSDSIRGHTNPAAGEAILGFL